MEVSSVAQYERNCHAYPMLKGLVDKPGPEGTIWAFMLTASKYKSSLISIVVLSDPIDHRYKVSDMCKSLGRRRLLYKC